MTFLADTIDAMVTSIIIEAVRNESLYIEETASGNETILTYITSLLCPSNCNNNGNCTSGAYDFLIFSCSQRVEWSLEI